MTATVYPYVIGEHATLEKIHAGCSLSRIGDGECALMYGAAQVREPANQALAQELRKIVYHPQPGLIVGIPTLIEGSPKYTNWLKRKDRILMFLNPNVQYYSSFVSRPDSSAEDLRTPTYCKRVVELWEGKRTVLVSEWGVAIYRLLHSTIGTGAVIWIECPHRETYKVIDRIEAQVLKAQPEIAMLSCGPAATCLAHRLTRQRQHAVDIGSIGSAILKVLHPMPGEIHHGK